MLVRALPSAKAAFRTPRSCEDARAMQKGRPRGDGPKPKAGAAYCWVARKAMTFARSSDLGRPAKDILVPGAYPLGFSRKA